MAGRHGAAASAALIYHSIGAEVRHDCAGEVGSVAQHIQGLPGTQQRHAPELALGQRGLSPPPRDHGLHDTRAATLLQGAG